MGVDPARAKSLSTASVHEAPTFAHASLRRASSSSDTGMPACTEAVKRASHLWLRREHREHPVFGDEGIIHHKVGAARSPHTERVPRVLELAVLPWQQHRLEVRRAVSVHPWGIPIEDHDYAAQPITVL